MTKEKQNSTKGDADQLALNLKKKRLRHNEFYDMQATLDQLYQDSLNNRETSDIMSLITSRENVRLAYRNIKRNGGSLTKGVNKTNIINIADKNIDELVSYVRKRLQNFQPHSIKRVYIPKDFSEERRPLGIPTIEDRIIQQCILQILEPICEAKFHKHSYGFRPTRSAHHAIARTQHLMNTNGLHYVVDIDIKGFFDNINHGKLLRQIWNIGIRDKNLISVISKMLKANIIGEGRMDKGTPQGGIISPLLSNIVLNELDWWISSQWETFQSKKTYSNKGKQDRELKKTRLKEVFIVRYADDFKIFCRDINVAKRMFSATKMWLKERLGLEVSNKKSKITNLRKNYTEFLGFKLKVTPRANTRHGYASISDVSDKAVRKMKINLKKSIKTIQYSKEHKKLEVDRMNSKIRGYHNYYKAATRVNITFVRMNFVLSKVIHNRLKSQSSNVGTESKTYNKLYGQYKFKKIFIDGKPIFPIAGIKLEIPKNFKKDINNFTKEGRAAIHNSLKAVDSEMLVYLLKNPVINESVEFNDNRISLFVAQNGKCAISGQPLTIGRMHTHHKKPRNSGGTDKYSNLIIVSNFVHTLIHATKEETIKRYINLENLSLKQIDKINVLRKLLKLQPIVA
ncbi:MULTISPECIES: group II intron reverse transcriptase/maturase [Cytobacillus]|uniref:group II intron reverse transcriptase/maturase n=1 Tax=Cytobacillus TaxID=2675230 RepID=UPI0015F0DDD4|nr:MULTISPECIES: group II intron reverse transcriptase/maturase [Cytobacillus]